VAVNDLLIHPRDNDLVLATHNRGIWILDQANALQELDDEVAASASHLFSIEPAEQVRYREERAHTGNMIFEGANPPAAAILDYWIRDEGTAVSLTVHDARGNLVATVAGTGHRGVNRALWDLRHAWPDTAASAGRRGGRASGPLVVPGLFTVRLAAGGVTSEQVVRVKEDPRLAELDPTLRARWTRDLLEITETLAGAQARSREVAEAVRKLDAGEAKPGASVTAKVHDLNREFGELVSRASGLRSSAEAWMGPLTADQTSQKEFFRETLETLTREWEGVRGRVR